MSTSKNTDLSVSKEFLEFKAEVLEGTKKRRVFPKPLWIGVNGFKGGSGNSYLFKMLVVSALELGVVVAAIITDPQCCNQWENDFVGYDFSKSNLKIYHSMEHAIEDFNSRLPDIVIMDLPNGSFRNFHQYDELEELVRPRIDVLVSPFLIHSWVENTGVLESLGSSDPVPLHRRILVPFDKICDPFSMIGVDYLAKFADNISFIILNEWSPLEYDLSNPRVPVKFRDAASSSRYGSLLLLIGQTAMCRSIKELREIR